MPVKNNPMLHYALAWVHANGIPSAVIAANSDAFTEVEDSVASFCKLAGVSQRFRVVMARTAGQGAGAALRAAAKAVNEQGVRVIPPNADVVLIAADVVTTLPVDRLMRWHHYSQASITFVCREASPDAPAAGGAASASGKGVEDAIARIDAARAVSEVYGITPARPVPSADPAGGARVSEVLWARTLRADVREAGGVRLSAALCERAGALTLTAALACAGVYVIAPWVLPWLEHKRNRGLASLRDEVVPRLAAASRRSRKGAAEFLGVEPPGPVRVVAAVPAVLGPLSEPAPAALPLTPPPPGPDGAAAAPTLLRVASLVAYLDANRVVPADVGGVPSAAVSAPAATPSGGTPGAPPPPPKPSRIVTMSVVHPDAVIGDGAVVKGAVIGAGARIGAKAHVVMSVIAAGAVVGTGAQVRRAVVTHGGAVGERQEVASAIVAPVVPAPRRDGGGGPVESREDSSGEGEVDDDVDHDCVMFS